MTLTPFSFNRALLRRPGRSVVNGLRGGGPAPEFARISAEHTAYAVSLERAGLRVDFLDADEAYPDSMFVEDPALVLAEGAIVLKPGAPSRMREAELLRAPLARRFATVETLDDGYADGGDVLVLPDFVMIGLSARTDRAGAEALGRILARLGHDSRIVSPPDGALHLKTAATLIDGETVLTTPAGAQSGLFAGFRLIVVDPEEPGAANALRINETLIVSRQYQRTTERLARDGHRLVEVDTTHVARIDGGLTCMSLRYRDPE